MINMPVIRVQKTKNYTVMAKYHLQAIELTKEIGKVYRLSRKNVGDK